MSWDFTKESYCKERMQPHWNRFKATITKPFARGHKARLGIVDFSHAYVNLFVEAARACPYTFGHYAAFSAPAAVIAVVFSAGVL